jgi:hypothetical protein
MSARPCAACGKRPALFFRWSHKGRRRLVIKADKDHTLCGRCWRAIQDSRRLA